MGSSPSRHGSVNRKHLNNTHDRNGGQAVRGFFPFSAPAPRRCNLYNGPMHSHVLLFDIDGTSLSSGGAGKTAIESALTDVFQVPVSAAVTYSGRTDRAICRDLLRLHG